MSDGGMKRVELRQRQTSGVALVACLIRWLGRLTVLAGITARAHDPYEITTRAYLYSNHLELRIEMEFPAAMLLAGSDSVRADSPAADQFALALPALRARAARFIRVTAGAAALPVTSTNVSMGVENHVRFVLHLPAADADTLQFAVGELKSLSDHGPYGTSLTVVDMVRNQVLGQSVLFGDSAPMRVGEATNQAPTPAAPIVIRHESTNQPAATAAGRPARSASWVSMLWLAVATAFVTALIVARVWRR